MTNLYQRHIALPRLAALVWIVTSLPIGLALLAGFGPDGGPLLAAWPCAFAAAVIAICRGWGWAVPCTVWGITLGWLLNPAFSGASISPIWETLLPFVAGGVLGALVGVALDFAAPRFSSAGKNKPHAE